MLSLSNRIAFLLFAFVTLSIGLHGFYRVGRTIGRGRKDTDARLDHLPRRVWYAITTTLSQRRTFRRRPFVSLFHSLIFYGFLFYLLVNWIDLLEGFYPFSISSDSLLAGAYNLLADVLSALVLVGVVALVLRRFVMPSRRDFTYSARTVLHEDVKNRYITRDSIIVSIFILFHVGSRAVGAGAKMALAGTDHLQPFATLLSHMFTVENAPWWRIFGYWGALGSVLAFWMYFPRSKHIHIFLAPAKYLVARNVNSGVLPTLSLDVDADKPKLVAKNLEDFAWPRLLDAYACIQCNRCQDVCPATITEKSLSPSALEINKRMELNHVVGRHTGFTDGAPSSRPVLEFALSPEAAWACTTCGACLEVCPVQDEPMLDIVDVRRHQVMMEGNFPTKLQNAFRSMERSGNPWGISHDKRMDWADGLNVRTTQDNPEPDVLFWVGCAASYDTQAQKTARAFAQLLEHAHVNFAVLGKRECCTGDTARRAGNEYLYRQLAERNVATLNDVKPKLIVTTCPHCLNSVGKEYKQIGGDYKVLHHTEYLNDLVRDGRLKAEKGAATTTYHDPCYLGRHHGGYEAPRNLLNVISSTVVELDRSRENSFCCGAGGAQFWKEEEGTERISDNRYAEVSKKLGGSSNKVLAVACPFCKSMLQSTPSKGEDDIEITDVAELLWQSVQHNTAGPELELAGIAAEVTAQPGLAGEIPLPFGTPINNEERDSKSNELLLGAAGQPGGHPSQAADSGEAHVIERKKWKPKREAAGSQQIEPTTELHAVAPPPVERTVAPQTNIQVRDTETSAASDNAAETTPRKKWSPVHSRKDEPPSSEG